MCKLIACTVLAATILAAGGDRGLAGPPPWKALPADASWVVHIDFDVLRESPAASSIGGFMLPHPEMHRGFRRLWESMGIDPAKDLHGLTFVGRSPDGMRASVLIVRATIDRKRFFESAQRLPGYRSEDYHAHTLWFWGFPSRFGPPSPPPSPAAPGQPVAPSAPGSLVSPAPMVTPAPFGYRGPRGPYPDRQMQVTSCLLDSDLFLYSHDLDGVKAILDVLDGRAVAAPADSPLRVETPPGTGICIAATGVAEARLPLRSPITRQSDRLVFLAGEHEGQAFLDVRLMARSVEAAEQIQTVVEGFRAMAVLDVGDDAEARQALDAVQFSRQAETVKVFGRAPADQVVRLIDALTEHEKQFTRPEPDRERQLGPPRPEADPQRQSPRLDFDRGRQPPRPEVDRDGRSPRTDG